MIDPIEVAYSAGIGAFIGILFTLAFVVLLMSLDLQRRIKDDVSITKRIRLTITFTPKHIVYQTSWKPVLHILPKAALIGAVTIPAAIIFGVGFLEIFFA